MRRDPYTGFEYPFYRVTADVWNAKAEEYDREVLMQAQTYEEALAVVRKTDVNPDVVQLRIVEDNYDDDEVIAIKVATDDTNGYTFYDPRTEKEIA